MLDVFYVFLGVSAAIAAVLLYLAYNMTYWKRRGVPYLQPNLLLGSLSDLLVSLKPSGQFVKDLYTQGAGHRFVGLWTLQTPTILIRDPVLVKDILVKDFASFCDRHSGGSGTHDPMGRRNLFMTNNPEWKYLRRKMTPLFTRGKLNNLFPLMQEVEVDLRKYITAKTGKDGAVLEVKTICNCYAIDVVVSCAFGIKSNAIHNEDCEFRKAAFNITAPRFKRLFDMTVYFMLPQLIDFFRVELFGEDTKFLRRVFWEAIEHRERTGIKRDDVIDYLSQLRRAPEDEEFKFEGDNLVSQATIFFAAGFDTSATTFAFALYHLALEPEIQDKLRAEAKAIKEKFGSFTFESVAEMKYAEMVVYETLRINPPMPLLNRLCTNDYKIKDSDVVIEKGTPVWISMLGLHMDPDNFPDPERFDPERFSEERKADIKPCTFMPFGEGPKLCLGMRFGMISLKHAISRFLLDFKVERCPQTQVPVKFLPGTVITTPERGLELRIVPLDAN